MADKKNFAKLFETRQGQILVKLGEGDFGAPEVRYYLTTTGEFGVCEKALPYENSPVGVKKARAYFDAVDEHVAMQMRDGIETMLAEALA